MEVYAYWVSYPWGSIHTKGTMTFLCTVKSRN